ncbi:MAG: glycosyltransferase family 39 protein [Deltaproteobacteria bacterium]|nr:glycosyltransferase family 39 protein [Deltaproteobacteria bacterium]
MHVGIIHADEVTVIHTLWDLLSVFKTNGFFSSEFYRVLMDPPGGAYASYGKPTFLLLHFPFFLWFHANPHALIYVTTMWAMVNLVLVYTIARVFFSSPKMALLSVLILAFSMFDIQYSRSFLPHTAATTFLLASLMCYLKHEKEKPFFYLAVSGVLLGVSGTIHPTAFFFYFGYGWSELFVHLPVGSWKKRMLQRFSHLGIFTLFFSSVILFYEITALLMAQTSYLYHLVLQAEASREEMTSLGPLYYLKQVCVSQGLVFLIGFGIGFGLLIRKALRSKHFLSGTLIFLWVSYVSVWIFSVGGLTGHFRYMIPLVPMSAFAVAYFLEVLHQKKRFWRWAYGLFIFSYLITQGVMFGQYLKASSRGYIQMVQWMETLPALSLSGNLSFFEPYLKNIYPEMARKVSFFPLPFTSIENKNVPQNSYFIVSGVQFHPQGDGFIFEGQMKHQIVQEFKDPFLSYWPNFFQYGYESNQTSTIEKDFLLGYKAVLLLLRF